MFDELDLRIDSKGTQSPFGVGCTCDCTGPIIITRPPLPEHTQLCV